MAAGRPVSAPASTMAAHQAWPTAIAVPSRPNSATGRAARPPTRCSLRNQARGAALLGSEDIVAFAYLSRQALHSACRLNVGNLPRSLASCVPAATPEPIHHQWGMEYPALKRPGPQRNWRRHPTPPSRIPGGEAADGRPVELFAAMGQQGQESIAEETRKRQWHAQSLCCRKQQPDILLAERRGKARRREFVGRDQRAIGRVDGCPEQASR